jgi:adenine nucleotide transporter 17
MEGRKGTPLSSSAVVRAVFSESGVRGFWAGLLPSLVLISNPTIQYALYEQLLRAMRAVKRRRAAARDTSVPDAAEGLSSAYDSATVRGSDIRLSAWETFLASAVAKARAMRASRVQYAT